MTVRNKGEQIMPEQSPEDTGESTPREAGEVAVDREAIAGWLTRQVASYVDLDPAEIDPAVELATYRLDSIYALSLCGDIEDRFDLDVDATLAWDYPTVDAIAGYLAGELATR